MQLQIQRRAWRVLRGELESNVGGADVVELFSHDIMGEFGAVAFPAQVGEVKVAQVGGHDLRDGLGGSFVREMAMAAKDALFEAPRTARAILQHLHIVVRFEDKDVRSARALNHQLGHVAEIGDEPEVTGGGVEQKTDRVLGVMRDGEGVHEHVGDFKARAGVEEPAIETGFEDVFKFVLGGAVAVNGDVEFLRDAGESLNVVGVFVGDENGGEIFRRAPDAGEALADLARAEPGVHKYPRLSGFNVGTIPAGAAAENGQFDGHGWTLVSREEPGNFFRRDEFDIGHCPGINCAANTHFFCLNVECGLLLQSVQIKTKTAVADFSRSGVSPYSKLRFMLKSRWMLGARGVALALLFSAVYPGIAAERQVLRGHVPVAVARFNLQPTGQLPATKSLQLAIGLPLRNEAALDDLLRQIYDPTSPNFHHYLTPEQFTEQFGPTEQDYQAVIDFVKANGLTVTGTHPNRVVLDVSGSVADIERVFHVTLHTYRHPQEARDFYAPDVEPSIDLAVPILQVSGLNNYSLPHPSLKVKAIVPATGATPDSGSGPGNTYMGNDFRAAYVPGVSLNGSGQNVALVQFDGYVSNDIAAYISQAGLTNYPINLTNVPVNGGVSMPGRGNGEVCLDIEMVISMAPAVSRIIVYEAPNGSTSWSTMLSRIANDNLAKQISCSWSGGSPDPAVDGIFKQMASQGQSFFCASGDFDAFNGSIPFLLDNTNITLVGGTALTTTGPGGSYVSETVWNDRTPNPNGGDWGSSGGISPTYAIPGWQQGISMTANQGSTTMRNVPDVALTAKNVFIVADTNQQRTPAAPVAPHPCGPGLPPWSTSTLRPTENPAWVLSILPFMRWAKARLTPTTFTTSRPATTPGPAVPDKFYAVPATISAQAGARPPG